MIAVTIVLVYLAIGATLWALVLHPIERARLAILSDCSACLAVMFIAEAILTWPAQLRSLARAGARR